MSLVPATLALGLRSTAQSLGVIGRELGVFAALGIDLQVVREETAGPDGVGGLIAGAYDFAELGAVPLVQCALEGGDPVILLAAEPVSALYVLGGRGVSRPSQLEGLAIGVLSAAGQTGYSAAKMAERWGLGHRVRLVPLGTYPAIHRALADGNIAAGVLTADYELAGAAAHGWTELADLGREFGFQGPVLATTRRVIAAQRDKVEAVVAGYARSLHTFIADGDAVVDALRRHLGFVDASEAAAIHAFYARRFSARPLASDDGIARVIATFVGSHPQATSLSPRDVHEPSFLQHAMSMATATAQAH